MLEWLWVIPWFVGSVVVVYSIFAEPDRIGKHKELYDQGIRDFKHERQVNTRVKIFGLTMIAISMFVAFFGAPTV